MLKVERDLCATKDFSSKNLLYKLVEICDMLCLNSNDELSNTMKLNLQLIFTCCESEEFNEFLYSYDQFMNWIETILVKCSFESLKNVASNSILDFSRKVIQTSQLWKKKTFIKILHSFIQITEKVEIQTKNSNEYFHTFVEALGFFFFFFFFFFLNSNYFFN